MGVLMRRVLASMVVAGAALSLAAVVGPTGPGTSLVSPVRAGTSAIAEAVGRMPAGTTDMGFTDWARIRASLGAQDITGASPLDDKIDVLMSTAQREAAAAGFGVAYLRNHRDTWGWDTLDLEWEALYSGDGPPVSLVRLREGVDVDAIAQRYDERGFSTERVGDATVRSHDLDLSADWIRTTDLGVTNTAFLDDGRTLMFSSSREALDAALRTSGAPLLPGASGVVDALGEPSAAWLVLGPGCPAFTPLPIDPFDPDASIGPLATGESLRPWTALGVGYERPDWDPVGRVAMGFLTPEDAQADEAARSEEARTGISQRVRAPYADAVFTLDGSRVEGDTLVLDVTPADDMPRRLFDMVFARDMTFAGC